MSSLSNPKETREWIADWYANAGSEERFRWWMNNALESFGAAVKSCEIEGRWPSSWNPDDCRKSLQMIKDALAAV